MPAIAALTIDDGASTPVSKTYGPVTTNGQIARWADRSPSIPAGFKTISYEVAPPSGTRVTNKLQAGFNFPTVATVDTVDKVVRNSSGQITLNIHPESTLQERKDLLAMMYGFLAEADVKSSVDNLEPFY